MIHQPEAAWRQRLRNELEAKRLSWRSVSMKAGLSEGYLFAVLSEGKEPSISNINAICAAAELDPVEIMFGKADAA